MGAVVALIAIFLVGMNAGNPVRKDAAAPAPAAAGGTPPARPSPPPPGIGKAVRDGKFEFVVSRVDCSKTQVGVEHLRRTAAGKYCVVSLSVKNIADRPKYFLGSAQKALDAAGTEFGDDELAGLYANQNIRTLVNKIDPGERVTGKLVFDVPKPVTLTSLELHDSFLSGGARVTLR
ncbi:DUF4352 domain-containing protein [Actinoplanes sp. TBRC 11911]|uniref:DUF4352 domain-containing protein n=1 Tax=Actinoplanes sp. TBRC 11911 TaxID=2729386 RepID=UPI00289D2464|nr:DUF4352 domain-containing protein [Actinoplanes sp. TBRC 11911]